MRRLMLAAIAGAGALAMAVPADAYGMVATVTGTVGTMSQALGGAFAAPGVSIEGDPFSIVFVFNSETPLVSQTATSIDTQGGLCCITPIPFGSAPMTIDGITREMVQSPNSHIPFEAEIKYDAAAGTVLFFGGRNDGIDSTISIKMMGPQIPLSLDTPFSMTQDAGSFFRWEPVPFGTDRAILNPTSLTVVRTVPEPATWAMMLLGFFGLGAALRRRRAMALAA